MSAGRSSSRRATRETRLFAFNGRNGEHLSDEHIFIDALRDVLGLVPLHRRDLETLEWASWPRDDDGNRRAPSSTDDGRRRR